MLRLTPSQENYLEWIYRLSKKGPVRIGELAVRLNVKRPSVSRAVRDLAKVGLVDHKTYGDIRLTDDGQQIGAAIVRRHGCLTRLLVEILGIHPDKAEREVHRIEHVLREEVLLRLEVLVDFALSSEAWMKRLKHRIHNIEKGLEQNLNFRIGETTVHGGGDREKGD